MFRTNLKISDNNLNKNIPIYNVHATKLPGYEGLGSIDLALKNKDYLQYSSLHTVTNKIDRGEVIDREPYVLASSKSYCENEKIAFQSAIDLLDRSI